MRLPCRGWEMGLTGELSHIKLYEYVSFLIADAPAHRSRSLICQAIAPLQLSLLFLSTMSMESTVAGTDCFKEFAFD